MAITTEQQNQIAALTVGMLGVAPGKDYLDDLSGVYESNGGIAGVADYLVTTDQFNSFYADTETQAEKINQALDTLGFEEGSEARDAAFVHFNGRVEQGYSDQAILLEASEYLYVGNVDTEYADVSAQFQNRAEVASYYSIEKGLSSDDLDVLQGVVADVTADPASVEAVKEAIDNGEIGVDTGAPSDLTEALTSLSEAEAGVTAALASAAATVNAQDGEAALEGDALKDFVEQFDEDQLAQEITEAESAIADAEAGVNTAEAALLTTQTETFSAASTSGFSGAAALASAVSVSGVDANGSAVSATFDLGIDGGDRLTDANIAKALQEAQKAVNADKAQYTVSGAGSTASASLASAGDVSGSTETFTAKALQIQASNAESALNADESANGTNVELLSNLRSAIADFVDGGGDLSTSAASSSVSFSSASGVSGSAANGTDIATILNAVNQVLEISSASTQQTAADAVVGFFGSISGSAYAGEFDQLDENDSTFDAINAAIDAIENRDELTEASVTADAQFAGTDTGALVAAAEALEAAREGQKDAITKAEGDLTDAQDDLSDLTTAQDDFNAATSAQEEAEQYFEDNGLELPVSLDGGVTATADNDIFLFNGEESTVGGFGLEGDDQLFIGTDFTWSAIDASVDVAGERTGDAGALEVFAQQDGNNTVLTFENETFAGNAENGDDLTQVTLTGVNVDDLSLNADGFITIA